MKISRKHIVTLFLILLAAAPFFVPAVLRIQQMFIIHEMKEKLETESLQVIRIENDSIKWTDFGNECTINGRMFDVKSIQQDGKFSVISGLYDDEETSIILHLANAVPDSRKENQRALVIFGFTHFQVVENPCNVLNFLTIMSLREFSPIPQGKQLSAHTSLHSPPPDHQ